MFLGVLNAQRFVEAFHAEIQLSIQNGSKSLTESCSENFSEYQKRFWYLQGLKKAMELMSHVHEEVIKESENRDIA